MAITFEHTGPGGLLAPRFLRGPCGWGRGAWGFLPFGGRVEGPTLLGAIDTPVTFEENPTMAELATFKWSDSWAIPLRFRSNGQPIDLTAIAGIWLRIENMATGLAIVDRAIPLGDIVQPPEDGIVVFYPGLTELRPATTYRAEARLTLAGGEVKRLPNDAWVLFRIAATLHDSPQIDTISPATGPATGGTPVTIRGQRFVNPPAVYFGETPSPSVTFVSAGEIVATSPARGTQIQTVSITVTNPDTWSAKKARAFRYS